MQIRKIFWNFRVLLQSSFSLKIGTFLFLQLLTSPFIDNCFKKYYKPKNLKILKPKVTKILTNLPKKFCEFPP